MDKPRCWVKMKLKNVQLKVKAEVGFNFLNYIFNPTIRFVHILPNFGLKVIVHFEITF